MFLGITWHDEICRRPAGQLPMGWPIDFELTFVTHLSMSRVIHDYYHTSASFMDYDNTCELGFY
jgi:hypothetical protein